ncbi:MAG: hypothetical protein ABIO78_02205 [Thermoanaerobaculia bacterium]
MRVLSRVTLVVIVLLSSVFPLAASHTVADCPLSLVGSNPASAGATSPHGVFRSGNLVYVLRGQTLTTYTVNDLGDLTVAREDVIGAMAARETDAGTVFHNGYLYVSSEAGLEVFDLRNVRAGGSAPSLVSRTPNLHYRRLVANGSVLAALYPASDLVCYPLGSTFCFNTIDLFSISDPGNPSRVSQISSLASSQYVGFEDIAFNQGFLFAAARGGVAGYNLINLSNPVSFGFSTSTRGTFLVSNGTNLLGVGNDGQIDLFSIATNGQFNRVSIFTLPIGEGIDRANPLMFHPQAWLDEQNGRLITLLDERNPLTNKPARTIAFDVFDFTVPLYEGAFNRGYENISYVTPDEIKHNPTVVGSNVFVVGETNGLQSWGACGVAAGRIEFDSTQGFNCGGTELRGWVTGAQRIANVEIFLDNGSLGSATLGGPPRTDVSSRTPVSTWRLPVNLDNTVRGEHTIRAVATDALGNRRQFATVKVFFGGPGTNCSNRRRAAR